MINLTQQHCTNMDINGSPSKRFFCQGQKKSTFLDMYLHELHIKQTTIRGDLQLLKMARRQTLENVSLVNTTVVELV